MASITKRGDSYRIKVSCGYDASGKQIVSSMTWKPDPKLTQRQIEKELNLTAVNFENKVTSSTYTNISKLFLSEFCPQYLEMTKDSLSPTTFASYQLAIKNYIEPALGHLKLKDISPMHVQLFVQALSNPKSRADNKDDKIAPSTIRRIYSILRSILTKAYKLGMIETNPANGDKIDLPPLGASTTDIFTKKEILYLLECLNTEPLMYQALIQLAIVSGCRRGELVALQWNDIDFNNATLSINKSNIQITGQSIQTKEPKTKSSIRLIAIPNNILGILKTYKIEQAQHRLIVGDQWENGDWLFIQWNGKPMHPHTPTRWFSKFLKKHNITHRKFHALRHTSATLLLSSGANIKTVSSRLGHTELSTTNRYVHAVEETDRIAADTFDDLIKTKQRP